MGKGNFLFEVVVQNTSEYTFLGKLLTLIEFIINIYAHLQIHSRVFFPLLHDSIRLIFMANCRYSNYLIEFRNSS